MISAASTEILIGGAFVISSISPFGCHVEKATRPFSLQAKYQSVQEAFHCRVNDLDDFSTAVPTMGRSSCSRQRSKGRRRIQWLSCCHLHGGLWISSTSLDYLRSRIEPTQNVMPVSINRQESV